MHKPYLFLFLASMSIGTYAHTPKEQKELDDTLNHLPTISYNEPLSLPEEANSNTSGENNESIYIPFILALKSDIELSLFTETCKFPTILYLFQNKALLTQKIKINDKELTPLELLEQLIESQEEFIHTLSVLPKDTSKGELLTQIFRPTIKPTCDCIDCMKEILEHMKNATKS